MTRPRPTTVLATALALACGLVLALAPAASAAEHRLGVGANYWKTVDELQDHGLGHIDDSGVSWMATYQYVPAGLFRWEIDLEYFDKGFGGSTQEVYSPQTYLLIGSSFYAGIGVGVLSSNGFEDDISDPFYAAKVGIDSELLPNFHLDIFANYRFDDWSELDQADTDTVFLGAAVRFAF